MYRKTVEELEEDLREKLVIDVREQEEYKKETIPGAVNIYWEEFEQQKHKLQKDMPIYLMCYTGQKSDELADDLNREGYEAYSITEGYRGYLRLKLKRLTEQEDLKENCCFRSWNVMDKKILKWYI